MRRAPLLAALLAVAFAGCALPGPGAAPVTYPREVLGGAPWTDLVVEIDHAPGRAPSEAAKAHLLATLKNVTAKTTITLVVRQELSGEARTWNDTDLMELERVHRTTAHAEPVAVLHVLYPAGTYYKEGVAGITIAGVALGPVTVFLDTLRNVTVGGLPLGLPASAVATLERSTLLHEAGHGFGLVDNGLEMARPHEDAQHPGHSSNPNSVMYWSVDSVDGLRESLTGEGRVPDLFDANDLADIAKVARKA